MTYLAIRGASTCEEDTKQEVTKVTQALLEKMIEQNSLDLDSIVSVLFTATGDIHSEFPATAARSLKGFSDIPLMCARELDIDGSMPMCIRIMMHVDVAKTKKDIKHIFMGKAKNLRKDLTEESQ